SVVEEDGTGRTGDGRLQIAIVKDDVGRLAAQFQRDLFEVPGSRLKNQFADLSGTSEGNLVNVRMRRQSSACGLTVAWDDVHHPVGNASFLYELAQPQTG